MCEAKVYLDSDRSGRPLMEDVILLQPEGDEFLLVNLLGEQKRVRGRIKKIAFLRHTVYLTAAPD
ncbi:MAG: CooT family nickel-binding protein [Anaerolineae bacterium]|nr:CooT family nickel-binding protein [Anaerolineae bacterium]